MVNPSWASTDQALGISIHPWAGQECVDCLIANNVFYNCEGQGISIGPSGESTDVTNNEIRNNICLDCGNNSIDGADDKGLVISSGTETNTYTNNCFYTSGVTNVVDYYGTDESIASFNNETTDTTTNNISADPLFTDAPGGDFTLSADSPCLNTGIDVFLTQDITGTFVPQGGVPDMGAYERLASAKANIARKRRMNH